MSTIPIKLSEIDLKKIDYLIKAGRYKNRSQAIKSMIMEKLDQEILPFEFETPQDEADRKEILKQLLSLKKNEIKFLTKKSAIQLVSEGRERL